MNHRLASLAAFLDAHPLDEKILVVPSHAAGQQVVHALARRSNPSLNLRVETVAGLAHAVAVVELAGSRTISRALGLCLLEQAIEETKLLRDPESYFGRLRGVPGLAAALFAAFDALRHERLDPGESLGAGHLVSERKATELLELHSRYEEILAEHELVDGAAVLRCALRLLDAGTTHPFAGAHFLVVSELALQGLERDLLLRLAGKRLYLVDDDPVADLEAPTVSAGVVLSRQATLLPAVEHAGSALSNLFALRPSDQPPPDTVVLRRGLGEVNEVHDVIQSVLERGIPLDTVEVLHTDPAAYVPLLHDEAMRLGIPCTFAEGIPLKLTAPGRALLGFLDWLERDFEQSGLCRLLASGALDLSAFDNAEKQRKAPSATRAIRHLRKAGIGWGRERYVQSLEALIASHEARRESTVREDGEDEGTPASATPERTTPPSSAGEVDWRELRLAELRGLLTFVKRLLKLVPEISGTISVTRLARSARRFLDAFGRSSSELDGQAIAALVDRLRALEELPQLEQPLPRVAGRIRDLVAASSVGASAPRPGQLHVAHFASGGCSARAELCVLGLDAQRFPSRSAADPSLLDEERQRLGNGMVLAQDRPGNDLFTLTARLASHRGRITLSYSARNLIEGREVFPSSILLQAYRLISGEHDADYSRLDEALPEPAGFLSDAGSALTDSRWWLGVARRTSRDELLPLLDSAFPWFAQGRIAREERESERFTAYDGYLDSAGNELDFRSSFLPLSASRLETLARCPFAFFIKEVLGIKPAEEFDRDAEVWLEPLEFGSLLHEVYERFLREISGAGELPSFDGPQRSRLAEIAEEGVEKWLRRIPTPSEAALARTRRDILRALEIFLRDEARHCRKSRPRHFEVPFGMAWLKDGSSEPLASDDPVPIALGAARIFLRGYIDRIDEVADHEYHVWDYKTGSTYRHKQHRPLDGGQVLQHALYAEVAESLLRERDPQARVTQSGYFFAGPKGHGERIAHTRNELAPLSDVLTDLMDLLAAGALPHATDADSCKFCDYQRVCGGAAAAAADAKRKLKTPAGADDPLVAYRRLHGRNV